MQCQSNPFDCNDLKQIFTSGNQGRDTVKESLSDQVAGAGLSNVIALRMPQWSARVFLQPLNRTGFVGGSVS